MMRICSDVRVAGSIPAPPSFIRKTLRTAFKKGLVEAELTTTPPDIRQCSPASSLVQSSPFKQCAISAAEARFLDRAPKKNETNNQSASSECGSYPGHQSIHWRSLKIPDSDPC